MEGGFRERRGQAAPRPMQRVLASVVLAALMIFAITGTAERSGGDDFEASLTRAFATMVVVKGLNGVISVLQDVDVGFTPLGVGVNVGIGEVLDPLNDLLERFASVLLWAVASLGVQKVLMAIGASLGMKVAIALVGLAVLVVIWWRPTWSLTGRALLGRLFVLLLLVRFAVPLGSLANEALYQSFLGDSYQVSMQSIEEMRTDLEAVPLPGLRGGEAEGDAPAAPSTLDTLKSLARGQGLLRDIMAQVSQYTRYVVNLITVFVMQTLVLPLLFLWCFYRAGVWALGDRFPSFWGRFVL